MAVLQPAPEPVFLLDRCCNLRLEFRIRTTAITTQFVATPLLRVAFEVAGPADGFPVVLLHGWPDDVRTWDSMLPALHREGFARSRLAARLWADALSS